VIDIPPHHIYNRAILAVGICPKHTVVTVLSGQLTANGISKAWQDIQP
jgi:hypothetical protein